MTNKELFMARIMVCIFGIGLIVLVIKSIYDLFTGNVLNAIKNVLIIVALREFTVWVLKTIGNVNK